MAKLKKRSDGRYTTSFIYEGKRYAVYSKTKTGLTDKILEKKEALKQQKLNNRNPVLTDYYERFTELRRSKVKGSTILNQQKWFNRIKGVKLDSGIAFGDFRIGDIRPADVQELQLKLINSNLSTQSVNDCLAHLSHVFSAAVKDETIDRNPCKCIDPVRRTEPKARDTYHRALTKEETACFFAEAARRNSFYQNHCKMMIQTGIRIGELSSLTEKDIDRKNGCIHITTTVTRTETGAYTIGDSTKTYAGTRDIPLNDTISQIVEDQKALNHAMFGLRFKSCLFPSTTGEMLREYSINREIKRITTAVNIEHFTCHAFRDTFATRFMEQRPHDFKILSEILGHANTKITLDLYTHVMKESKETAMKGIEIAM